MAFAIARIGISTQHGTATETTSPKALHQFDSDGGCESKNTHKMQTWNINLKLKVSDNWVAEGVDFSDKEMLEKLNEHIREFMPYLHYEIEFKVSSKIVSAPSKKVLDELQGY